MVQLETETLIQIGFVTPRSQFILIYVSRRHSHQPMLVILCEVMRSVMEEEMALFWQLGSSAVTPNPLASPFAGLCRLSNVAPAIFDPQAHRPWCDVQSISPWIRSDMAADRFQPRPDAILQSQNLDGDSVSPGEVN